MATKLFHSARGTLISSLLMAGVMTVGTVHAQDIANGGFETGDFTGWTVVDSPMPFVPMQVSTGLPSVGFGLFNHMPTEGNFGMVMGFETLVAPVVMSMTQNVTINAARPNLRFTYRAGWDMFNFANSSMDREGFVRVRDVTGTTLLLEERFLRARSQTYNWDTGNRDRDYDLSQFAGQTVQLSFEWVLPEEDTGPGLFQIDEIRMAGDDAGSNYCTAVPNSTGVIAEMSASGSNVVAANDLVLETSNVPFTSFGFYITGAVQGFTMNPGGSNGNLCLSGSVGRYVGPGQVQQASSSGRISLAINLTQHPTPNGLISVNPGETWNFQAWYRDSVGGVAGSNFSDGYEVTFQ